MVVRSLLCVAAFSIFTAWAADQTRIERGEYLLYAGGCISCHTIDDAGKEGFLAGGRALETAFGTFYTPNITPDRETGIGDWSDAEFIRAFRQGVSPENEHYYPAFPYTSYSGITDSDLLDLKAYLFSLPPVKKVNRAHDLAWFASSRWPLGLWKKLYFEPGEFQPVHPTRFPLWNRGAYLVRHLGHCGECHTPRRPSGGLNKRYSLAGNPDGPEGDVVPNITPHETGLGDWSLSDIETFLELGMDADGDFAGASMTEVIDHGTSHLTAADRKAIAVYLKSLKPLPTTAK